MALDSTITSIAIRRSLHHKSLCETVRYARSVPGQPCSPARSNRLPGEISVVEPPDPIPNSEVKRNSADGSVGFPCESRSSPGSLPSNPQPIGWGFVFARNETSRGRAIAPRHARRQGGGRLCRGGAARCLLPLMSPGCGLQPQPPPLLPVSRHRTAPLHGHRPPNGKPEALHAGFNAWFPLFRWPPAKPGALWRVAC